MPRFCPDLPPGVSFVLADGAIEWMETQFPGRMPLLPWQRFMVRHALATAAGADGRQRLLFSRVVLRLARQQGKTFLARRVLAWRLLEGPRVFGQPQRVINTHPNGEQAEKLLEPVARGFGYRRGGLPGFTKQVFASSWFPGGVESETESAWLARSMTTNALTGNQGITFAYVDELQDAKDQQVTEALGGSLSGARVVQPQRWFTGTGEKPGSDLLRKFRRGRFAPGTCWVEWSAPEGTDIADEEGWRWASPDWSEERADYLRAQLVEVDPKMYAANFLLSDESLTVLRWLPAGLVSACARAVVSPAATVAAVEVGTDQVSWSAAVSDGRQVATMVARPLPEVAGWLAGLPRRCCWGMWLR